ncbi:hypothetical protein COM57_06890, partial [Bacillus pseudomycoides]
RSNCFIIMHEEVTRKNGIYVDSVFFWFATGKWGDINTYIGYTVCLSKKKESRWLSSEIVC